MSNLSLVKKNYIDYINNVINNNKISHAYLIEVDNYNTDFKYVIDFIKMILCDFSYDDLTKSNNNIINLIDNDNYPDIVYISSDTSIIKKTSMIDLQKEFKNKSLYDNKKIYVIKEAEKLNASSANTILKFLEEPEKDIIAFLITTNRYKVIDTILSRCQILSLKENNFDLFLDDSNVDFANYILNPDLFFINYNELVKNEYSDKFFFKDKLIIIENMIIEYLSGRYDDIVDNRFIFEKYSNVKLLSIISIIEEEIPKLDYNVNYKLWIDSFFSKLIGG